MSWVQMNVAVLQPTIRLKLRRWLESARHHLSAFRPPLRDWHFWMIQSLVISIAVIHSFVETLGVSYDLGLPYFIPSTLYLIPLIYAALTFGFSGALATALWATILTTPNWIFIHEEFAEKAWCIIQMFITNSVAVFVGWRINLERIAWRQAESVTTELKASRVKYRSLFESSPIAILILDFKSAILEANPAASVLFGLDKSELEGKLISDLVGKTGAQKIMDASSRNNGHRDPMTIRRKDGSEVYLRPMLTEVSDTQGNLITQLLLRDVTEEHGREVGLLAYTAHVINAQEEERQRIARELHDDTIQSLVLLCRRLDSLQNASQSIPSLVSTGLQEARNAAEDVVNDLRNVTKALRPPILDDLGMVTSVRRLLTDFTERNGTRGQLKLVGAERRLPSDTELAIFRITQEALRNIERHARATRVAVTLTFAEQELKLEVADNGIGFSMKPFSRDSSANSQLGLLSMQERAELLRGKLEIQSSPGKGTRLTVSVPAADGYSFNA